MSTTTTTPILARYRAVLGAACCGLLLPLACRVDNRGDRDPDEASPTDDDNGEEVGDDDGEGGGDGDANNPLPLVGEALDCGRATNVGDLADGNDAAALRQTTIDRSVFPDALCNDGSAAIFYYRPATDAAASNKWVIELMGGGGCQTADQCAKRWCSVDTNFSKTQMTSTTSPPDTNGTGILARATDRVLAAPNPIETYNQVLIKYCSSDTWRGTRRDVAMNAAHPVTGNPIAYRIHFLGHRIIEATLDTLRREGVGPLVYDDVEMPDLDSASEVILAGASAGGGGTVFNLDWLKERLGANSPGVEVLGLIDSTFGPDLLGLDFSTSTFCSDLQLCSDAAFLGFGYDIQKNTWGADDEASCVQLHRGEEWKCASDTHVIQHHLTTPFFVRQGLGDGLISDPYVEGGLKKDGVAYTLQQFGADVRAQILALPDVQSRAEEGAAITAAAGGFGPVCSKHETLRSTADTLEVTITPNGGSPTRMFDVWNAWRAGAGTTALATQTPSDTHCP
jgi:hypothetical protein